MHTLSATKPQANAEIQDDRRLWELYKLTLGSLLSGESFELCNGDTNEVYRLDTKQERQMIRHLVDLAYYAATVAQQTWVENGR